MRLLFHNFSLFFCFQVNILNFQIVTEKRLNYLKFLFSLLPYYIHFFNSENIAVDFYQLNFQSKLASCSQKYYYF